jgi:hypothetical protein
MGICRFESVEEPMTVFGQGQGDRNLQAKMEVFVGGGTESTGPTLATISD